ncbi:hypothetical protein EII22_02760 [Coriobacteriales bacterium OH1046]|nr:hypothetical protein EII22_02760 [Coriobacteriales bacterium OH1046]
MDSFTGNDDYLLYQIAKMYYLDEMPQDAIAKKVGFSRSYISRLLDKAKERKIVTFVVVNPLDRTVQDLEERLRAAYGLRFVAIADVSESEYKRSLFHPMNEILAAKANAILPDFLSKSRVVALGFGAALYTMSKTLPRGHLSHDVLFMPAVGTTGACSPQTQSNTIVDNIASAFGARSYYTNIPIVIDQHEVASTLFPSRFGELMQHWGEVDTVIVGLGVRYHEAGDAFSLNEASEEYREAVAKADAVGDLLTRYFREDGSEIELDKAYVRTAITLERLSEIERVLCVAGGPAKLRGIRTAIKSGYVNCLVTDLVTARKLISLEENA